MLKINIMLEKAPEYSKWEFLTEGLLSWSFSSSSSSGPELSSHGMCTGFLCQVTKFVKPSLLHVSCWLATLRVPYTDVLSCEAVSGQVGVWFRIRMVHSEAIAKHETQKGKKLRWELYQTASAVYHLGLGILRSDLGAIVKNGQFCLKRFIPMPALKP